MKALASRSPAPSVKRSASSWARPCSAGGSAAAPPSMRKEMATTGTAGSDASQAVTPAAVASTTLAARAVAGAKVRNTAAKATAARPACAHGRRTPARGARRNAWFMMEPRHPRASASLSPTSSDGTARGPPPRPVRRSQPLFDRATLRHPRPSGRWRARRR